MKPTVWRGGSPPQLPFYNPAAFMVELYPSLAVREKASSSFLKKRTKKLLIITGKRCRTARTNKQKFLLLFSKRSAFLLRTAQSQWRLILSGRRHANSQESLPHHALDFRNICGAVAAHVAELTVGRDELPALVAREGDRGAQEDAVDFDDF
jgi:hypothetical protein